MRFATGKVVTKRIEQEQTPSHKDGRNSEYIRISRSLDARVDRDHDYMVAAHCRYNNSARDDINTPSAEHAWGLPVACYSAVTIRNGEMR